jgi:glycerol-3-phosphate cytidylyltransferase-like family protein
MVGGVLTVGMETEPSKWPHKPFALMASSKRIENVVQFKPVTRSFGTEEGRMLVMVRAVVDIVVEGQKRFKISAGLNNLIIKLSVCM